jgi:hypothetical protein
MSAKTPIVLAFPVLFSIFSNAQSEFKQAGAMSFNLVAGYQSLFRTSDVDAKLTANNFTPLATPRVCWGGEFATVEKKIILKFQFRGTGIFVKNSVREASLQTMSLALQFGQDLLPAKEKTFFFPFLGFRWFDQTILGKSTDDKKLYAGKSSFDFMGGFGLKHFFNTELRGAFNNVDISLGASLPAINGRWKNQGSEFVSGTYKLKPTWYITLSIGRGFRPASIR